MGCTPPQKCQERAAKLSAPESVSKPTLAAIISAGVGAKRRMTRKQFEARIAELEAQIERSPGRPKTTRTLPFLPRRAASPITRPLTEVLVCYFHHVLHVLVSAPRGPVSRAVRIDAEPWRSCQGHHSGCGCSFGSHPADPAYAPYNGGSNLGFVNGHVKWASFNIIPDQWALWGAW